MTTRPSEPRDQKVALIIASRTKVADKFGLARLWSIYCQWAPQDTDYKQSRSFLFTGYIG